VNGQPSAVWRDHVTEQNHGPFTKVFFADNGSTGVEVALKMALQWQQQAGDARRTRFAALANGYHGETAGAMSVSDLGLYKSPFASLCTDVAMLEHLPYRSGPEDPAWNDASTEWPQIQAQLDRIEPGLAAIIVEPILQGAAGMRFYSPDLLRRLRAWSSAHGVLLIADEIAAGMGRLGSILASHLAEVVPDIVVLSKGLTGGFLPLSTIMCGERIATAFDAEWSTGRAFLHSNTYAGNALAVAVANAALDIYARDDICAEASRKGILLRDGLRQIAARFPGCSSVRGCGMVAAIDLRQSDGSPFPKEARIGWKLFQIAQKQGALLRPLGDTIYLFPPLTITESEMQSLFDVVEQTLRLGL
jgi:adenosylmethionine-8-amino-7-oxononanoate aminotransferase